ncbi:MAG: PilZ domain-containing protein [Treponema sp.]|nr:PilZ domain-containing protein [Treponema sp.]
MNSLLLYPLQMEVSDFWKSKSSNNDAALIFIIIVAVIIAAVIIINLLKKGAPAISRPGPKAKNNSPWVGQRHFSGFALNRLSRNIGLDSDQTKMLDYVLKNDGVIDAERSVNSPNLLDRSFRRAYNTIERTANTDEEAQQRLALLFSTRNVLDNSSGAGTLSSTSKLPDNITAVLSIGNDKYPVKVLSTKGDSLNVECPENVLGSPIKLPRGSKLSVVVFTKSNKGFSFETRVLGVSTAQGDNVLQLAHSSHVKRLAQRRFRRRQALIACNFYFVHVDGAGRSAEKRLIVDKRRLTGNIMDISVGGCSIKSTAPVSGGAKLKIEYVNRENYTVAALGQVLRTNRTGINTISHIKFLKVPRKSMNIINAFVYEYSNE